jgi:hypothetical protein
VLGALHFARQLVRCVWAISSLCLTVLPDWMSRSPSVPSRFMMSASLMTEFESGGESRVLTGAF